MTLAKEGTRRKAAGSVLGQLGVHPLCFSKSVEVVDFIELAKSTENRSVEAIEMEGVREHTVREFAPKMERGAECRRLSALE